MATRILTTYATRFGSTKDVAEAIADELRSLDRAVDVRPVQEADGLHGYACALIGSAVQEGAWLPEAVDFVRSNAGALQGMRVALFTVHIQNLGEDSESRRKRLAYLDTVRPLLDPVAEAFFAGRFARRAAPLLLPRWLALLTPSVDLRNMKRVRAWARGVAPALTDRPGTAPGGG